MVEVSVVMPAFNEERDIGPSIKQCQAALRGLDYEILVVTDGSTDETVKRAVEAGAKVVGYSPNQGKGYATKYGVFKASGNFIVCVDAGMEISLHSLKNYLAALESADFAVASKRHPESKLRARQDRALLSRCFHLATRALTGLRMSDTQTGLKCARADSIKRVLSLTSVRGYAFDVEVMLLANQLGMRVVEMPVTVEVSDSFSPNAILRMLVDLLSIAYRDRIRRPQRTR